MFFVVSIRGALGPKIKPLTATKSTVYTPGSTLKIALFYAKIRTSLATANY
jgi:hypothetical protein